MISLFKRMLFVSAVSIIVVGCANQSPAPVVNNCFLPSGHLVDPAFATATSTLSNPDCWYKFDAVFASLLKVCEGAPDMKNKVLFSDFIGWAEGEGVISKLQAKACYTQYFSHRFVSLPDTYQTCSHCSRLKALLEACWSELKNKEQGLLKGCGDKATYMKACDDLKKIELILEATCSACAAE